MSDLAERLPFVDKETEKAILGASLLHADQAEAFRDAGVREPHFFSRHHQLVWRRILQALDEQLGVGVPTVLMLLSKYDELQEVGLAYLASLPDGVPRLLEAAVCSLAHRLVECAVGRHTVAALRQAVQQLEERPAVLAEGFFSGLGTALQALSGQLAGRRMPDHVSHVSEVMQAVLASLKEGPPAFVDTPWPALNNMLGGGFAPGELVFLGARPGVGKTAAAIEIARRAAKRGSSVFMVSREMLTHQIGVRMLVQEGPVNATTIRRRLLETPHWRTIDGAVETLERLPIFITHEALDVDEIRRIVGLLADEGPLGLVIVDYLQLVDAPADVKERRLQVEAVSKGLKACTLDYQVPVLCLSSLSRPPEGRAPTLASLRESGNLEHDADSVILLHRPQELEMLTQCIVAKSRNGRTGMVELAFSGEYLRFEERYMGVA